MFSISLTHVTIAGPHPKFWKHLCQQAWDDRDVEAAKAMRGEIAAYLVYQADGAAVEWEHFQWEVVKELRLPCMKHGLGSPYAQSLYAQFLPLSSHHMIARVSHKPSEPGAGAVSRSCEQGPGPEPLIFMAQTLLLGPRTSFSGPRVSFFMSKPSFRSTKTHFSGSETHLKGSESHL